MRLGCAAFHKSGKKLLLKYGIEKQKEYVYEAVFNMNSTQDQVYQGVGSHLTTRALGGFNGKDTLTMSFVCVFRLVCFVKLRFA